MKAITTLGDFKVYLENPVPEMNSFSLELPDLKTKGVKRVLGKEVVNEVGFLGKRVEKYSDSLWFQKGHEVYALYSLYGEYRLGTNTSTKGLYQEELVKLLMG